MRYSSLLLAATLIAGCAGQPGRKTLSAPAPEFDPARFFAGRTESVGKLRRVFHRPKQQIVHGSGRVVEDRLILTQRVLTEDMPPRLRTWDLRRTAPGRWQGIMTEADGEVTLETRGNALHIRYDREAGMQVDEWLYLQPDGTTAIVRGEMTRQGVDFARTEERVRRVAEE